MRKRVKIIAAVAAIAVIGILIWVYMAFHRKGGDIEAGNPTTITPEATPTDIITPTGEAAITPEDTPTPVPELTVTPEATKASEPTDMPTPTLTPAPSREPEPSFTPTPSATPTPEPSEVPTKAPEATKAPVGEPTPTPLVEYKKDGVDVPIVQTFQVSDTTYVYVYENGNIGVADSASGYRQKYATRYENPENVDIMRVVKSLIANEGESIKEKKITIDAALMPTPTPTPTPYPTPNPEKPKMLASYKGDKDYGDITVEAWDNGYLYVKGTGVYYVKSTMSYTPQDLEDYWKIGRASGYTYSHLVIEEGITELKKLPSWANNNISNREMLKYIELPSTLARIKRDIFQPDYLNDITVTGYKDGEKVTFTVRAGEQIEDAVIANLDIKLH